MANTSSPLSGLLVPILQSISAERLQRAIAGTLAGAYHVTVETQDDTEVRGTVRNGTKTTYRCSINEEAVSCTCKDTIYRKVLCKHVAVLALHLIHLPIHRRKPRPKFIQLRLVWSRPPGFSQEHVSSETAS